MAFLVAVDKDLLDLKGMRFVCNGSVRFLSLSTAEVSSRNIRRGSFM